MHLTGAFIATEVANKSKHNLLYVYLRTVMDENGFRVNDQ